MTVLQITFVSVIGYFAGAISFAVIVAKSKGVDILKEGSGTPARPMWRVGLDLWECRVRAGCLEGHTCSSWPRLVFEGELGLRLGVIGLLAAIIGHSFCSSLSFAEARGHTTMGGLWR